MDFRLSCVLGGLTSIFPVTVRSLWSSWSDVQVVDPRKVQTAGFGIFMVIFSYVRVKKLLVLFCILFLFT